MVDGYVRVKISDSVEIEAASEEVFVDGVRRVGRTGYFFLIIASRIEAGFWIQSANIGLTADVVLMGMGDEDGGQLGKIGSVGAQCLVGGPCGIGTGSRVYPDQLSPIIGNDEVVFRELETREGIDPAGNDLGILTWGKSSPS